VAELGAFGNPGEPLGPAGLLHEVAHPLGVAQRLLEVRHLFRNGRRPSRDDAGDLPPMVEAAPCGQLGPAFERGGERGVRAPVDRVLDGRQPEAFPVGAVALISQDESTALWPQGSRQVLHDNVAVAVADE